MANVLSYQNRDFGKLSIATRISDFCGVIRYNPKNWFALIFHAYSKQVLSKLLPSMFSIGVLTALVCCVELIWLEKPFNVSNAVHSMLGFVLSLFLVFRTNTAYDRWWEGRKKWGGLVNVSRTLATRTQTFIDDEQERAWFVNAIPAFSASLRDHLRGGVTAETRTAWSSWAGKGILEVEHVPNYLVQHMSIRLRKLAKSEAITGEQHWLMESNLERMTDILGACERILKTPIPYSYSMFMKKFIFLYIVTLPLGFVATFGWWTIPVVMAVFYVLVSIELIAEEIEDPFGEDDNDLPLNDLCATMERNVKEIAA